MRSLRIEYGMPPPSDNHIRDIGYVRTGGKLRAIIRYTKEALDYKKGLHRCINDHYFHEVQRFAREHRPYMIYRFDMVLALPPEDLLAASWLLPGKKQAKSPYKKTDILNRHKLLEDVLSEATGIDDSLFWEASGVKLVGGDKLPAVTLLLEEVDSLRYGIPQEFVRRSYE